MSQTYGDYPTRADSILTYISKKHNVKRSAIIDILNTNNNYKVMNNENGKKKFPIVKFEYYCDNTYIIYHFFFLNKMITDDFFEPHYYHSK